MGINSVLATLAANAGKGALTGLAGTAAMTVSSTVEAKIRERGTSDTPATAAGTVLGVQPKDETTTQRFNTLAHWGYGVCWGTGRGLIGAADLFHHAVYVGATGLAYDWLEGSDRRSRRLR
ncbi:MAG: hypothetical protein GEV03_21275 [Streptosporangiales bacterium]|nr:hypothetical protein [Streptosporangiales bacterium]